MLAQRWMAIIVIIFIGLLGFTFSKLKPKKRHLNRMIATLNLKGVQKKHEPILHFRKGVEKQIYFEDQNREVQLRAASSKLFFERAPKGYHLKENFYEFSLLETKKKDFILDMTKINSKIASYDFKDDLLQGRFALLTKTKMNEKADVQKGIKMKASKIQGSLKKGFESAKASNVSIQNILDEGHEK